MTMEVLMTEGQISAARREMIERGMSGLESATRALMRKLRLTSEISVGDEQKSWDVLAAITFLEKHVAKSEPIADIGCFASEVLISLHKLGYAELTGIDLNPRLSRMPFRDHIRYEISDFMKTPFAPNSFQAVTSISVIEHGYNPDRLLAEMSRLIRPGGYLLTSFDYWPEKIDTSGTTFFGMDWLIFSRADVESFISKAARFGFRPTGRLDFDGRDKVIHCAGKAYTFAMLAMQKTAETA